MNNVVEFVLCAGELWGVRISDPESSALAEVCDIQDPSLLPGGLPLHGLVWRLLAQGGEHLAAHHAWMMGMQGGLWSRPSMTLGRTAAVAAVRALYVMRGEGPSDRRVRALQLLNDEAKGLEQIAKVARPREGVELDEVAGHVAGYAAAVGAELAELGMPRGSKKSDTDLMADAAPAFLENEAKALEEIELFWRHASATVHARVFTWDTGIEDRSPEDQLAAAWSMPAQVLEIAWDSWNQMRGADAEGRI